MSPVFTVVFRRKVLSAVEVRPVPHSAPGSLPTWPMQSRIVPLVPPTRKTTASLPLKVKVPLVWSAAANTSAAEELWANTYTSCDGIVPVRLMVYEAEKPPFW